MCHSLSRAIFSVKLWALSCFFSFYISAFLPISHLTNWCSQRKEAQLGSKIVAISTKYKLKVDFKQQ